LFFTEEVPAGTQASDVNSVLFRGRNNAGNASQASDPRNQSVHPVLKVDGAWYAHETGVVDPFPGSFNFFAVDFSAGNWAPLTVTNLDFTMGTIDSAELAGDFTLTKPSGAVEAWGLYNALLTGNTRFDMVEFRSDAIGSFMTPEPASAVMVGVAAVVAAARRRRAA
jgi:hypothetical protein